MNVVKTSHLTKTYGEGENLVHAVDDVNLTIEDNEFVTIVGTSGSGKSTLLNLLGGLDRPTSGEIEISGKQLEHLSEEELTIFRRRNVGFVFQNFKLLRESTVADNVALPLLYAGKSRKEINGRVSEVLKQVGLAGYEEQLPKNMSGGQQQRVSIARAISTHPKFLIADEPTGALDSETSQEIMNLFKSLNQQEGTTIIMVTHDPHVAEQCERVIKIIDGRVISDSKEGK